MRLMPNPSLKKILIIGTAQCVWDDLLKVRDVLEVPAIMVVKDIGAYLPFSVQHWVTLHPKNLPGLMQLRAFHKHGNGERLTTHSNKAHPGIDVAWDIPNTGGGSGMYAIKVALRLGYEDITLAGIPMDGTPHFYDPPWRGADCDDRHNRDPWRMEVDRDPDTWKRIKSLSGWTHTLLG